jgi:predicted AAA+ superfamily ATPase
MVYLEIKKNKSKLSELYFFRDTKVLEVDIILQNENKIVPIEIKA